jgi:hypothetical protein
MVEGVCDDVKLVMDESMMPKIVPQLLELLM